ncbi:hypothetical protein [Hoeflea sp.]|uniref:hypothetical protein n=1 Tax=Hoeflea sp. TaxID=1940281 RepID=UPI003B012594
MPNKNQMLDGVDVVRSNAIRRNKEGAKGIAHLTNREDAVSKRRRERSALADAVANVGRMNRDATKSAFEKSQVEERKKEAREAIKQAECDAEKALELVEQRERELAALEEPPIEEPARAANGKTKAGGSK